MKIIHINTSYYGSTGKIMLSLAEQARNQGHLVYTFSKYWRDNSYKHKFHNYIGNLVSNVGHRILAPLFGNEGNFSVFPTLNLIRKINKIDPDIIHLHNIHGWYLNYKILFKFLSKSNVRIIWTFHDCWPITGHCPHFLLNHCDKWQTGCFECSNLKSYPEMRVDKTKKMWLKKKQLFSSLEKLEIVCPSAWLNKIVGQSFLKGKKTYIINNGIDLNIFKPLDLNFKEKYGIPLNKKIILGVSFNWDVSKGLDVFNKLQEKYYDKNIAIVLVGINEKSKTHLNKGIIAIEKTNNVQELVEIYNSADVFVNPTREDNYPTVNMEAIACGLPVITFDTGGAFEMLNDEIGIKVKVDDFSSLSKAIDKVLYESILYSDKCVHHAKINYNKDIKFMEYINLYEKQ